MKYLVLLLAMFAGCGNNYRTVVEIPVPEASLFISIMDPCGDYPGYPDEVLLLLNDGTILAWYKNVGLSILEEGKTYTTTDKQKCKFSVVDGKLIEE